MSANLPAKGFKDHIMEYQETIDQLFEIIQKYNSTHQIAKVQRHLHSLLACLLVVVAH
jgi:hypothetical protein